MYPSPRSLALGALASVLSLVACAVPQPAASQALRSQASAYELEVLVDGTAARSFLHEGETHILGQRGSRYVLRVHNRSGRRVEAVVSVDGLDVIDGQPGDFARKRGYLVPAYGSVDIDGWRLSDREAAAFRFAAVGESYAAKTGRPRNIGVIGVAIFPERREPVVAPRPAPVAPPPTAAPRGEYKSATSEGMRAERQMQPQAAEPASPAKGAPADESASSGGAQASARRSRGGLGTEFGEAVSSEIQEVEFKRANRTQPAYLLGVRYNDRAGLLALGIPVDGMVDDLALRQSANPFPVSDRRYARPPHGWHHD